MQIDTLIKNADLFTMRGAGVGYVDEGAIAILNGTIQEVGNTSDLEQKYDAQEVIDASGKMVLPGFVDCHIHTYWGALRGVGQDTRGWMHKGVGPFRLYLDNEKQYIGSKMNILEGLAAGTTTFGDYSPAINKIAGFYSELGARARLTCHVREVPDVLHELEEDDLYPFDKKIGQETLNENLKLIENWHGAHDNRITALLGPQGPDFLSEELLEKVNKISEEKNVGIHMHVAQAARETKQMQKRYGMRSIEFLEKRGFLNERLIAVHLSEATKEEMELLAKSGASMILCSGAKAIIAGEVPLTVPFIEAGGVVGLGSDQCSGNNCNQMINEMKLTTLFNKIKYTNPEILPAWKVLRMATIEGAQALGIGHQTGSIEKGKKADIVFIDLNKKTMQPVMKTPMRNHVPNLVYSARGNEVEQVMVDGKTLYKNNEYLTVDEEKIMYDLKKASSEIMEKITPEHFAISKNATYMKASQL